MSESVRGAARKLLFAGCLPAAIMPVPHLFGHVQGKNAPPAELASVLAAMESSRFDLMGTQRSMMDVYDGFTLSFALLLALVAILALLAARQAPSVGAFRAVAASMTVGQLGLAAIAATTMAMPLVVMFALGAGFCLTAWFLAPDRVANVRNR